MSRKRDARRQQVKSRLEKIANSRGFKHANQLEKDVDTSFHGYDQMTAMRERFGVRHNDIYCGYLMQPITVDDNGDSLEVYGGCVLNDNYCTNTFSPQDHKCYNCELYIAYFNLGGEND